MLLGQDAVVSNKSAGLNFHVNYAIVKGQFIWPTAALSSFTDAVSLQAGPLHVQGLMALTTKQRHKGQVPMWAGQNKSVQVCHCEQNSGTVKSSQLV